MPGDLKSELELLRGERIEAFPCADGEVPCNETSDRLSLCAHPLVSVVMVTYNHERYIRRAIEGVAMQETDFEYELLVGEDCSQDRTREICLECQKRYPQKVRVLWSEKNVNDICGNSRRCMCRCRGEFIALCEGDDFWTDPHKLQRQVDALRTNPSAGLCFTSAATLDATGAEGRWPAYLRTGIVPGRRFAEEVIDKWQGPESANVTPATCTALIRRSALAQATARYEIFNWRLRLGDTTLWLGLSTVADVVVLPDVTACYRIGSTSSVTRADGGGVMRDGGVVRVYFSILALERSPENIGDLLRSSVYFYLMEDIARRPSSEQRTIGRLLLRSDFAGPLFLRSRFKLAVWVIRLGLLNGRAKRMLYKWFPVFRGRFLI